MVKFAGLSCSESVLAEAIDKARQFVLQADDQRIASAKQERIESRTKQQQQHCLQINIQQLVIAKGDGLMFLTSSTWFLLLLAAVPLVAYKYFRRQRNAICFQFDISRCRIAENASAAIDLGAASAWLDRTDAADRGCGSTSRRPQGNDH